MKINRKLKWTLAVLVPVLLVGGFFGYRALTAPYHFQTVETGVLYRSGTLEPDELKDVLADYGIKTVVNVRAKSENAEDWYPAEVRACEESGVRLVDIPTEAETPPTPAELDQWFALLKDPANLPILVHCQHGVVRTGMFVAAYQLETTDRSNREIWDALPFFGHRREGGKRDQMRDFVLGYKPSGALKRPAD